MPRFVRPSFVDLDVSGLKNRISTGPRSRDGYMDAQFFVRQDGQVVKGPNVSFIADTEGKTVTVTINAGGEEVYRETFTQ